MLLEALEDRKNFVIRFPQTVNCRLSNSPDACPTLPAHSQMVCLRERAPRRPRAATTRVNGEATVISFTSGNEFFQGRTASFPLMRFFLELTQHIPPKGCQFIRRYGLYESRSTWAKLIAQVYGVDPHPGGHPRLVCPRCPALMRVLAVITQPE